MHYVLVALLDRATMLLSALTGVRVRQGKSHLVRNSAMLGVLRLDRLFDLLIAWLVLCVVVATLVTRVRSAWALVVDRLYLIPSVVWVPSVVKASLVQMVTFRGNRWTVCMLVIRWVLVLL